METAEQPIKSFVEQNARWLLGVVFTMGILYGEFKYMRTIDERVDKKIKILVKLEEIVSNLQIENAILKEKIANLEKK